MHIMHNDVPFAADNSSYLCGGFIHKHTHLLTAIFESFWPTAFINNDTAVKELDERFDELAPFVFLADPYTKNPRKNQSKEILNKLRRSYFGEGHIEESSTPQLIDVSYVKPPVTS